MKGSIQAYGEENNLVLIDNDLAEITYENQPSLIFSDANKILSELDFTKLGFTRMHVENEKNEAVASISVKNSELKIFPRGGSSSASEFSIKSVADSLILFNQCNYYFGYAPAIERISNSVLSMFETSVCIHEQSPFVYSEGKAHMYHGVALRVLDVINSNINDMVVEVKGSVSESKLENATVFSA